MIRAFVILLLLGACSEGGSNPYVKSVERSGDGWKAYCLDGGWAWTLDKQFAERNCIPARLREDRP